MTTSFAEKVLQQIHQLQWDFIDADTTWAKVLYDFEPEEHDELAVTEDQYIQLMMEPQVDWTFCRALKEDGGKMGYVPTQYFEILDGGNLPPELSTIIAGLRQNSAIDDYGADIELDDDEDEYTESTSSNTFTSTTNTASALAGDDDDDDYDDATFMDSTALLDSDDEGFDTDSSDDDISSKPPGEEGEAGKEKRKMNREKRKTLGLKSHFRHLTTTMELQELHHRADEHKSTGEETPQEEGVHVVEEEEMGEEKQELESDSAKQSDKVEPGAPSDVPAVDKHQAVINEIVSTEKYYVDCLNIFDRYYLAPMRLLNMSKETSVIEERDFDICFKPISVIKMVNTELLSCLQKIQRGETIDPDSKFPVRTMGQLFIKTSPLLKMYHVYVNPYDNIAKRVKYLSTNKERFSMFLASANKKVRRESKLTLWDLMIAPVQRLPRYTLLLRELKKHTEEDNEEWDDLSKALFLMEGITAHINDNVRESENTKRMAELSRAINWRSFSESLIQSHRKLITEGTLRRIIHSDKTGIRSAKRNVFLFNDLLLICNKNSYNSHAKFTETPLPWIKDKPNTNLFELVTPTKNTLLKARTLEEKEIWIKNITGCIQKQVSSHPELKDAPQAEYEKIRNASSASLGNIVNASSNSLKRKPTVKQLFGTRKKDRSRGNPEDVDSEGIAITVSPQASPLASPRQQGKSNMSLPMENGSDSNSTSPRSPFQSPRTHSATPPTNVQVSSSKAAKLLGLSVEEGPTSPKESAPTSSLTPPPIPPPPPPPLPSKRNRPSRKSSIPSSKPILPPLPPKPPSAPSTKPSTKSKTRPGTKTSSSNQDQSKSIHQMGAQFAIDRSELSKILERRRLASESGNAQ